MLTGCVEVLVWISSRAYEDLAIEAFHFGCLKKNGPTITLPFHKRSAQCDFSASIAEAKALRQRRFTSGPSPRYI